MRYLLCPDSLPVQQTDDAATANTRAANPALARLSQARIRRRHSDTNQVPAQTPAEHWLGTLLGLPDNCLAAAYSRYAHAGAHRGTQPGAQSGAQPGLVHSEPVNSEQPPTDKTPATLTVTPASLHATSDHLILHPPALLNINRDEAASLTDCANEFLAQDNISFEPLAAGCWLLHLPENWQLRLHGSPVAAGRNIDAYMPDGADGRRLRALLNEVQMLWHDHRVNDKRDAAGELRINTVWVEGIAPTFNASQKFDRVFSANTVTRGLIIASGTPATALSPVASHKEMAETMAANHDEDVLVELSNDDAPDQLQEFLDNLPAGESRVILTNDRHWVELSVSTSDRLKFWRRTRLAS